MDKMNFEKNPLSPQSSKNAENLLWENTKNYNVFSIFEYFQEIVPDDDSQRVILSLTAINKLQHN